MNFPTVSLKKQRLPSYLVIFALSFLVILPLFAGAQGTLPGPPPDPTGGSGTGGSGVATGGGGGAAGGALQTIQNILNSIIPVLMIIATIIFLWGVIKYITAGGDEDALREGRNYMIFGLIGLFVMVAVWGIVTLLVNTFGVGGVGIPTGGPGTIN